MLRLLTRSFHTCLVTNMSEGRFCADYGKRAAKCKMTKCKQTIEKGSLRIAKIVKNPFSEEGDMKQYHHPKCLFDAFTRARGTTKVIDDAGDIEGWEDVKPEDKKTILELIKELSNTRESASPAKKKQTKVTSSPAAPKTNTKPEVNSSPQKSATNNKDEPKAKIELENVDHKDNSFREFRRLCATVSEEPGYNAKTEIMQRWFSKGSDGKKFQGNLQLWVRLLLPGVIKRVYNLQSKQLIKIYSRIFHADEGAMLEDLEKGDVAETITTFFEETDAINKTSKSKLTLYDIDSFLSKLATLTKADEQTFVLSNMTKKCTSNDLKMIIRLIKGDLRINAGGKHVLDALHNDAHDAFNSSRNIEAVVEQIQELRNSGNPRGPLSVGATVGQPVQPMLAAPCKSVEMAFKKCPNGIYSEIKYDGERVQLHKVGDEFTYYSRSLKPVMPHKVKHFKDDIPKAFTKARNLILDAEVLMVSKKTGEPLPFGTLGVHKAAGFADATPCLFIFDVLHYNEKNLMSTPLKERRKLLTEQMVEVGNSVKLSDLKVIKSKKDLTDMIKDVFHKGLEGLVLKDKMSVYEPGKRHWLKLKKDYLNEGAMADSADLVVLGAWFGTGNKGGLMSIFLMGCYDEKSKKWCTVSKVGNGHDDATLDRLQDELGGNMTKIKQDFNSVPHWMNCYRQMVPDFVVKDPKKSPVWEITGAEFSKADIHTADGISIRFPRVTKIRDDKDWKTATSLNQLKQLFETSKQATDISLGCSDEEPMKEDCEEPMNDSEASLKIKKEEVQKSKHRDKESVMNHKSPVKIKTEDEEYSPAHKKAKLEYPTSDNTKGRNEQGKENRNQKSFDKRHIKTNNGMEIVVKSEKANDNISSTTNIACGVIASNHSKVEPGEMIPKKNRPSDSKKYYIYNLVLKKNEQDQASYESLRKSLVLMREHMKERKIEKVSFPLKAESCIIRELSWNAVRTLIKNVFYEENTKITVYNDNLRQIPPVDERKKKDNIFSKTPFLDIFEKRPLTPIKSEK